MEYYLILALSFALASFYSIHLKTVALREEGYWGYAIIGGAIWLVISFLFFPFILGMLAYNYEGFVEGYKVGMLSEDEE